MKPTRILFLLMIGLFAAATTAQAQNLNAIKAEMKERLPKIEQLWKQGLIGENNQGFLSPRGELSPAQKKLVEAENDDRKAVYQAIAKSTGASMEDVGKQRARQIAKRAAKGLWLQSPVGKWYQK